MSSMMVRKRNGDLEHVDLNKITNSLLVHSVGLDRVDPMKVALQTIAGLKDGSTTKELDELSIKAAADMIAADPQYSSLAAKLMSSYIEKEVKLSGINNTGQYIQYCLDEKIYNSRIANFFARTPGLASLYEISSYVDRAPEPQLEYFAIKTLYDRYFLRDKDTKRVIETPKMFFARIAIGTSDYDTSTMAELYDMYSTLKMMPATPILFNSCLQREQLASCYIFDAPEDSLAGIFKRAADIAQSCKFAAGIGADFSSVRCAGSWIDGTNGPSNGIIPFMKIEDSCIAAVNQGGKRKGSQATYLTPWHADILQFLEVRNATGSEELRTHNTNIAVWVPDLLMKRVVADEDWSLFDPKACPELRELWGDEFEARYIELENEGKAVDKLSARTLYLAMMRTLGETGNGWQTYKDAFNSKSNQTFFKNNVIHSSNLCTEIGEVTSLEETAVCNLLSLVMHRFVNEEGIIDLVALERAVGYAVHVLDLCVSRSFYPIDSAERSNLRWRPIGLGVMGHADTFFKLGIAFDSPQARELSKSFAFYTYCFAISATAELASKYGPAPAWDQTRAFNEEKLSPELWGENPDHPLYLAVKEKVKEFGMRNTLCIAFAPNATIGSIASCGENAEPQTANLFARQTLSGSFVQINKYLVADMMKLGLWGEDAVTYLKMNNGSIQGFPGLPQEVANVYKTVWEIPMKSLIDMARDRAPYIDQAQSLNLFMENPTIEKLSSMYKYVWSTGLKSTYYLRSRAASTIQKVTVPKKFTEEEALICSLENPEACEACQ